MMPKSLIHDYTTVYCLGAGGWEGVGVALTEYDFFTLFSKIHNSLFLPRCGYSMFTTREEKMKCVHVIRVWITKIYKNDIKMFINK